MLDVVERVVYKKCQLWHNAQLMAHTPTKFTTYGLFMLIQHLKSLSTLLGGENAYVHLGQRQVGANPNTGYSNYFAP